MIIFRNSPGIPVVNFDAKMRIRAGHAHKKFDLRTWLAHAYLTTSAAI